MPYVQRGPKRPILDLPASWMFLFLLLFRLRLVERASARNSDDTDEDDDDEDDGGGGGPRRPLPSRVCARRPVLPDFSKTCGSC